MNDTATTKAVLIGRHHDITAFCSTDASRLEMQGVHYNAEYKRLEATDGAIAVRVPVCDKAEEFPPVTAPSKELADCVIRPETLKKGLANTTKGATLPVLQYAHLCSTKEGDAVKMTVTATDLDAEQAVTARAIDVQFPKLDQVWPDKAPTFAICLDAAQLKRIAEYAVKHCKEVRDGSRTFQAIRLEFTDELSPMRFSCTLDDPMGDAPKLEGLLMPVRLQ